MFVPVLMLAAMYTGITLLPVVAGVAGIALLIWCMALLMPGIVGPLRVVEKSLGRIADLDFTPDPETARFEAEVALERKRGS
ncbi:MAG: hypothetical protein LBT65_00370 [Synergistaceae bacterium]|nr:hypothetical protein [Synergistaceae bacterium]